MNQVQVESITLDLRALAPPDINLILQSFASNKLTDDPVRTLNTIILMLKLGVRSATDGNTTVLLQQENGEISTESAVHLFAYLREKGIVDAASKAILEALTNPSDSPVSTPSKYSN